MRRQLASTPPGSHRGDTRRRLGGQRQREKGVCGQRLYCPLRGKEEKEPGRQAQSWLVCMISVGPGLERLSLAGWYLALGGSEQVESCQECPGPEKAGGWVWALDLLVCV